MEQGLLTDLYYDEILKIINEIRATERENILKAARMIEDQVNWYMCSARAAIPT